MHVRLATDTDRDKWNRLVIDAPSGSFMQSWEWGEVQAEFGLPIWRLLVEDERGLLGVMLVVQREVSFGRSWLYVPRGPVYGLEPKVWRLMNDRLMELGGGKKVIFVRCDPMLEQQKGNDVLLAQSGWQKAEREVQPRHTLVLDLVSDEQELLKKMHHKTRYNIRLAKKKGVKVRWATEANDGLDDFLRLAREVEGRGDFHFHPPEYYRAMQRQLGEAGLLEIGIAEKGGQTLAAHLLIEFGDTVTYAHGASSSQKRELMAPHLLQWESILRAKDKGYRKYDFFGVAPEKDGQVDIDHPWAGITRFKTGFGGRRVDYIGAYDLVLDPTFYVVYNMARRMKGALR